MGCRRILLWVIGLDILLAIVAIAVAWAVIKSGAVYVGADRHGPRIVDQVLATASDRSSARHARGLKAPPLDDPARIRKGFGHYQDDCVVCHGAPGVARGEVGRGLQPSPPNLAESAQELPAEQVFWITKHGIRMTGMPAWGKIDPDEELWNTVAFVMQLPKTTPDAYQAMVGQSAGRERPGGG